MDEFTVGQRVRVVEKGDPHDGEEGVIEEVQKDYRSTFAKVMIVHGICVRFDRAHNGLHNRWYSHKRLEPVAELAGLIRSAETE